MDRETTFDEIKLKVKEFCEERDWDRFHNAKELATALTLEASELLEPFRYKSEKEVDELFLDSNKKSNIEDEMADIIMLLFRMAQRYDIDLSDAFFRKIDSIAKKYPVDKVKGQNKKYDEY